MSYNDGDVCARTWSKRTPPPQKKKTLIKLNEMDFYDSETFLLLYDSFMNHIAWLPKWMTEEEQNHSEIENDGQAQSHR